MENERQAAERLIKAFTDRHHAVFQAVMRSTREFPGFWQEVGELQARARAANITTTGAVVREWPRVCDVACGPGEPSLRSVGVQTDAAEIRERGANRRPRTAAETPRRAHSPIRCPSPGRRPATAAATARYAGHGPSRRPTQAAARVREAAPGAARRPIPAASISRAAGPTPARRPVVAAAAWSEARSRTDRGQEGPGPNQGSGRTRRRRLSRLRRIECEEAWQQGHPSGLAAERDRSPLGRIRKSSPEAVSSEDEAKGEPEAADKGAIREKQEERPATFPGARKPRTVGGPCGRCGRSDAAQRRAKGRGAGGPKDLCPRCGRIGAGGENRE